MINHPKKKKSKKLIKESFERNTGGKAADVEATFDVLICSTPVGALDLAEKATAYISFY